MVQMMAGMMQCLPASMTAELSAEDGPGPDEIIPMLEAVCAKVASLPFPSFPTASVPQFFLPSASYYISPIPILKMPECGI